MNTVLLNLNNSEKKAIIDLADFEIVSKYKWRLNQNGYVVTYNKIPGFSSKTVGLHQFLLSNKNNDNKNNIDHKDRNPLNNCKNNLRFASCQQNSWNSGKRLKINNKNVS